MLQVSFISSISYALQNWVDIFIYEGYLHLLKGQGCLTPYDSYVPAHGILAHASFRIWFGWLEGY